MKINLLYTLLILNYIQYKIFIRDIWYIKLIYIFNLFLEYHA